MIERKHSTYFITFFFYLVITTDFIYKYSRFYLGQEVGFLPYIKSIIALIILSALFLLKSMTRKDIWCCFLLVFSSIIHLILTQEADSLKTIILFAKYAFGVIVMVFFFKNYHILSKDVLGKTIVSITILNFCCIFIGYCFEVYVFETYPGDRFGYNGFFKSTSTATYFYMFVITYAIVKAKNVFSNSLVIISIFSSLFVGSKSLYAFIFFISFILITRYVASKLAFISRKFLYLTSLVFGIVLAFSSIKLYFNLSTVFNKIVKEQGFVTAFFSFRNLAIENLLPQLIEKYQFTDLLFGGVYKVGILTEMALVDLFLTFGFIGSIIYFYFLSYNFPKIDRPFIQFVLGFVVLIIVLRGNFLYYPSVIFISSVIFSLTVLESNERAT
tara:strand:+ start:3006 stop:4163 length:1158 start_codon:yes stop_codon:yes gene_type:complete